jgi:uncharacterized protein YndB with AHSA1/START domain
MTSNSLRTVKIVRRFDLSAERVFDAWLDPQKAGKWLFATPTGKMVRVEIDARVGGSYNFTDRRDGQDIEHVGSYLEIDRPRRLVFTLAVPKFSKEFTRVSIDIAPLAGGCELTLSHEGILPEWADKTQEGWGKILTDLSSRIDPNASFGVLVEPGTIRFERLLPGPIERVWAYLTDSEKRAKWFCGGEMEPCVGGKIELRFDHAKLTTRGDPPPEKSKELVEKPGPFYTQEITRYEPLRVLGWTWDGGEDGATEVTFELTPQGEKVLLVLTQRRLAKNHLADVSAGWHTHLALLAERLTDREPLRFWSLVTEMEGEYERRLGARESK